MSLFRARPTLHPYAALVAGALSGCDSDAPKPVGRAGATTAGATTAVAAAPTPVRRDSASGEAWWPDTVRRPNARTPGDTARRAKGHEPVWPNPKAPAPIAGSILPAKRIVAFYGNPLSKKMGVLGELPMDQMLAKLDTEVAKWNAADPAHPVQPALHLIAIVAQGTPGKDSTYRYRAVPELIEKVYGWAKQKRAILFLDVQIGKSTLQSELAYLLPYLQRPDVHLALDPEFAMTKGGLPGGRIGTYDATHINYAIDQLIRLVDQYKLPPKVLIVHRFTGPMVTNYQSIKLDPRVQVVMDMDGWGPPHGKKATWSRFIYPYPVQYTGFKLFYHNDTKNGFPMMTPKQVLALFPPPIYIQYQ
ncbi:hypothetical protein [Gemmatirosa kalamazoonensis]|nr:hypothetical protein [Gemmatirosa kalamazoonensis]